MPKRIENYNHWMGGEDLSDQRIAYYHPNLRSRRNWIPMFVQIMSIVRNNAYIVHREYFKNEALSHKKFTLETIRFLMNKAHEYSLVRKQSVGSSPVSATLTHCVASRSTSKSAKLPRLEPNADITSTLAKYPERKIGPRALHTRVTNKDKVKGRCVYCSLLYYEKKRAGEDVKWDEEVAQTVKVCGFCSYERESSNCCFLCKKHFDIFHDTP